MDLINLPLRLLNHHSPSYAALKQRNSTKPTRTRCEMLVEITGQAKFSRSPSNVRARGCLLSLYISSASTSSVLRRRPCFFRIGPVTLSFGLVPSVEKRAPEADLSPTEARGCQQDADIRRCKIYSSIALPPFPGAAPGYRPPRVSDPPDPGPVHRSHGTCRSLAHPIGPSGPLIGP